MAVQLDERALRTLAQYRPFDGGAEGIDAVHDDLVVAACQTNGGAFGNLEACRKYIQDHWHIELEINEIRSSRDRLQARHVAERVGGGFQLSDSKQKELEKVRAVWEGWEAQAMEEWETSVRQDFPLLSDGDLARLEGQLRPWLDEVICRHGAEASLLLYPGEDRAARLIQNLGATDLSFLPDLGSDLNNIRGDAFRMFVREPTESQLAFLGRLLNTGFYQTVLSLDPGARQLAAAEARQTVLYLDTNFLYAVLGVGSQVEAHSASRLLELCRKQGYALRVTPWTVAELRTSIASSRADVSKVHRSQKAARVMAQVSGEKGFAPAYWRALRDHGTDPSDFFGKFEHFQQFLDDNGIVEHPEMCAEVDADTEGIQAYSSPLEAMYGVGTKNRVVIEHDAKIRLLIEKLRGDSEAPSYMKVRYWFLTESTSLPTYGRLPIRAGRRPKYPFCILTSTWAQIVRSVMPRTEDLDAVVVGLLASPYVGYKLPISGVPRKAVERVVARIDTLKDVPPTVAVALVGDEAMAAKIGGDVDEDEVSRIVEEGLTLKAQELERRIAESAEEAVTAQKAKAQADERAKEAAALKATSDQDRDQAQKRAEEAERREADARQKATVAAEREAALTKKADESEERGRELEETRKREQDEKAGREAAEHRELILRNVLGVLAALLVAAGACVVLLTKTVDGTGGRIAVVIGAVLCVYLLIRVASARLATEFVLLLTVLAAVATIIAAFAAGS